MQNNQVGGVSNTIGLSTVNGALVYLCARTSTWPSAERRAKYFVYVPSPSSLRRAMYLVYLCACRVRACGVRYTKYLAYGSPLLKGTSTLDFKYFIVIADSTE